MTSRSAGIEQLDRELEARGRTLSLGPGRPRATTLTALVSWQLPAADTKPELVASVEHGLCRIVRAILQAFPDNIFWDLDYMLACLIGDAGRAEHPVAAVEAAVESIVELQEQFGRETAISFRYVHDFLYGFDWARWVAKAPDEREAVGPFDPRFVDVMRKRGEELLETIDSGSDPKYPRLEDERHRNPFGFSRAPRAELVLHRHLARRAMIPVEAWRRDARPQWNRDFTALRQREALALGLAEPNEETV